MAKEVVLRSYIGAMTMPAELGPEEAWGLLVTEPDVRLVDVRTPQEWQLVGVPDLSDLNKDVVFVGWQLLPLMNVNPDFSAQLNAEGCDRETPMIFICRSGGRSRDAATAMTANGYRKCFNFSSGFEGKKAESLEMPEDVVPSWQKFGLPWKMLD